ncbi:DUF4190 domain-containing protein [Kribbella sp. DT2]|uniref:DUF4190 domain-containing protein n=1 Tax=Kribbella sp. DT2 TaxID=3393427 RepID=UPI003CF1137E
MTQPPYQHDPNRPQDRPRSFPSYAEQQRPRDTPPPFVPPPVVPPYSQPQQPQQPHTAPQQQYAAPPYQHQPYPTQQYPPAYGQPPVPYGYGYPGAVRRTNGLATAALVTGLASILFTIAAPVAIGLGIAALVQIKRRNEDGTAQAVVGLVVGSAVTVIAAGLIALFAIGSQIPDQASSDGGTPVSSSDPAGVYIDALVVGECFDDTSDEDEVARSTCGVDHDGELYAVVTLPAQTWPGDEKVGDLGEAACDEKFASYVGIAVDDSELDPVAWYPERAGWNSGDRDVYCTVYGPYGDPLDKTVKNSKR